jgi:hypothetical protein
MTGLCALWIQHVGASNEAAAAAAAAGKAQQQRQGARALPLIRTQLPVQVICTRVCCSVVLIHVFALFPHVSVPPPCQVCDGQQQGAAGGAGQDVCR